MARPWAIAVCLTLALFVAAVSHASTPLEWRLADDMGGHGRGYRELKKPSSIAVIGGGFRAVTEIKNSSVVIFDDKERWVRTLGEPDGDGDIEFDEPIAVEADRHGRIWVADRGKHTVTRLGVGGKAQLTLGGKGAKKGRFKAPSDIALDSRGNVYVADTGNRRVQVFSPSGKPLDVWKGSYGIARNMIKKPVLLAFSKYEDGGIWLVNSGSSQLEKFELDGKWSESLALSELVEGDVVIADIVFYQPFDRMVVLDSAGNRILVVGWRGDLLAQFALPDDVIGSALQVEGNMDLLVADMAKGRVLLYRRGH